MLNMVVREFESHLNTIKDSFALGKDLEIVCEEVIKTLKAGGKIMLCGNGGSAGDAQHIAAELTGRYKSERLPLAGIALTTDTSALTAIGNDYGYDEVFARQVFAIGKKEDLIIAISTSGNSVNIIKALEAAKKIGMKRIGFSGKGGGLMNESCDLNLIVPSNDTARIQEMHILFGHIICQAIDDSFEI